MKILAVTNNKTQILKSPSDLSVIIERENTYKQSSPDFAFFSHPNVKYAFAQIHKTEDYIEIWRIKDEKPDEDVQNFDFIFKLREPGMQAVACTKTTEGPPEFAVGYTNGRIKMMDIRSKKPKYDFPVDSKKSSVFSLDVNNNNQLLSSVYENGSISIFGLKTNVRTTQINDIKEATLARFHPSERYNLAVVSYLGEVAMYKIDNHVTKVLFQQKAHEAPCRDVAMSEDFPNRLFSCGLDSAIRIYDIRHKHRALQIQRDCGFTSISVDKSGNYFVAGDLKGTVVGFDIRNVKHLLAQASCDSDLITRVAFFPQAENAHDRMSMFKLTQPSIDLDDLAEAAPEVETKNIIESIEDYRRGRVSDIDLASYNTRVSSVSTVTSGRPSTDAFGANLENALFADFDNDENEEPNLQFNKVKDRKSLVKGRRSSYLTVNSPLQRIHEEGLDSNSNEQFYTPIAAKPRFSSTPATPLTAVKVKQKVKISAEIRRDDDDEDSDEVIEIEDVETPQMPVQKVRQGEISIPVPQQPQIMNMSQDFEKKLEEKIEQSVKMQVQSLNMDLYQRHIEMSYHVTEQRLKLQDRLQMIEDCMAMLMNDDYKISRALELQKENDELKQHVKSLMKTISEMTLSAQASQSHTLT